MKKEVLGSVSLFLVALIWGAAFIAVDLALDAGWETFPLLTVRGLLGGMVLLPFCIKRKFLKDRQTVLSGVILGILFFIAYALQTLGQQMSNVYNAAFLTALYVVFSPIVCRILFKEKQERKVYFAGIISIIGVLLITIVTNNSGFVFNIGDILLIFCALFFALQIVFAQRFGKNCDVLSISCIQLFVMGILSLIMMPISNQTTMPTQGLIGVLYAAIFSSAIASVLQIYAQQYVEPGRASIIMSQETLIAAVLGFVIAKTLPSIYFVIGGVLMFSAILIIEVKIMKKLKLSKYKFLLFDVDDTLLDFHKAEQNGIIKSFNEVGVSITDEMLKDYSIINKKLWTMYELGEIEKEEIFKQRFNLFINKYNIPSCDGLEIEKKYRHNLKDGAYLIDNAITLLDNLKDKYELVIITNGIADTQHNRLKLSGLDKYFKYLFISEEVGYKKPDFEFFEHVKNNVVGFDPKYALVIGDTLTSDILGGNNYNIDTCWFNPHCLANDKDIIPTFEIKELIQLMQD